MAFLGSILASIAGGAIHGLANGLGNSPDAPLGPALLEKVKNVDVILSNVNEVGKEPPSTLANSRNKGELSAALTQAALTAARIGKKKALAADGAARVERGVSMFKASETTNTQLLENMHIIGGGGYAHEEKKAIKSASLKCAKLAHDLNTLLQDRPTMADLQPSTTASYIMESHGSVSSGGTSKGSPHYINFTPTGITPPTIEEAQALFVEGATINVTGYAPDADSVNVVINREPGKWAGTIFELSNPHMRKMGDSTVVVKGMARFKPTGMLWFYTGAGAAVVGPMELTFENVRGSITYIAVVGKLQKPIDEDSMLGDRKLRIQSVTQYLVTPDPDEVGTVVNFSTNGKHSEIIALHKEISVPVNMTLGKGESPYVQIFAVTNDCTIDVRELGQGAETLNLNSTGDTVTVGAANGGFGAYVSVGAMNGGLGGFTDRTSTVRDVKTITYSISETPHQTKTILPAVVYDENLGQNVWDSSSDLLSVSKLIADAKSAYVAGENHESPATTFTFTDWWMQRQLPNMYWENLRRYDPQFFPKSQSDIFTVTDGDGGDIGRRVASIAERLLTHDVAIAAAGL